MDNEIKASLTASESWIRGLNMLLFAVIYSVAEVVLSAVVVLQFIFLLLTRGPNERLLEFGDDLSVFIYQIIQYLTFNSDEKPFPFAPWPYAEDGPVPQAGSAPPQGAEDEAESIQADESRDEAGEKDNPAN